MNPRVEVVCCSPADVAEAEALGVDRIELCSAITQGGLTPSIGLMAVAHASSKIPIMAMIRPRAGGFCYSDDEFRVMEQDAQAMVTHGADGIVFGIVLEDGRIDRHRCDQLLGKADGRQTVFHRAFDTLPDPFDALEELIDLGFTRILTSGQQPTASEGAPLLRQLRERANGRIEILPAGTIRPHNAAFVVAESGCDQIHLAAFRERLDPSCTGHGPGANPYLALDGETITSLLSALR